MRNAIKDITSGIVALTLIGMTWTAAIHMQPAIDATAQEARQA